MGRLMKGEVATAFAMLRRHKWRSLLTMLGIVMGVAASLVIIGIAAGVQLQLTAQNQRLGSNVLIIHPGHSSAGGLSALFGSLSTFGGLPAAQLTSDDLARVRSTPGVTAALPLRLVTATVSGNEAKRRFDLPVIGTDADFPALLKQTVAYGTVFDATDASVDDVVLGANVAVQVFGQNVPLGQTATIFGQPFIVTGILAATPTLPGGVDFNNAIFLSGSRLVSLTNDHAPLYEVLAQAQGQTPSARDTLARRLTMSLTQAHGGQQDFAIYAGGQAGSAQSLVALLTLIAGIVAVLCLLVGGVGIMNVMLVSVTERMQEIGIRKAVGATNRQILLQFLTEAAVLSMGGAVLGVVLALVLSVGLQLFTDLTPLVTWQAALAACIVALLVGCIFGAAPALKAARRDPIAALRNM